MTNTEAANGVELETDALTICRNIEPRTHRILAAALDSGRTTFADLPALESEDLPVAARIAAIRLELQDIADEPYSTPNGEMFCCLTEEWMRIDPISFFLFLDEVEREG